MEIKWNGNEAERMQLNGENGVTYLSYKKFEEIPWIVHGFSTRLGGVSEGVCSSMNLSFSRGDLEEAVMENYRRIGKAIGFSHEQVVTSDQTHTTNVRVVTSKDCGCGVIYPRKFHDVDGMITNEPNVILATFYADCVPLYLVDVKKKAIGLSHSGWRGTVGKIGAVTIKKMQEEFGSDVSDIYVAVGPSICQDCYEVSEDVIEEFKKAFDEEHWEKLFYQKSAEKYQLKIGSHSFIDTFEDQLVGLNVGDEKDVNVTFPTEYHQADLAGKPAVFKVKIHNIRERIMPELNDEFVQNSSEFDTVEQYTNNIREKLTEQANQNAEIEVDNRMLDTIVDNTKVSVPDTMVDSETDRMIRGMEAQLSYYGATLETYATQIGKTVSEIKANQRMMAERQVKGRLVLEKLIRTENIDVSEEDVDAKIAEIAETQGVKVEEYKNNIGENGINQIANELLMKKLLDFLRQNNTIK